MKTAKPIPAYVPLMAAVTFAYLAVEIPFSVRLVEVLGSDPTLEDVNRIEAFGRLLTGVAVAIFIVGTFILPRAHERGRRFLRTAVLSLAVGAASVWGTYRVLDFVADLTGHLASGEARKDAFAARVAVRQIVSDGRAGRVATTGDNDWKAFVAVAPMIASAETLVAATGRSRAELAREEAVRIVGTPPELRKRIDASVRPAYENYLKASDGRASAIAALPEEGERAWQRLRAELARRYPGGISTNTITGQFAIRHIRDTMKIPVSSNWDINDRRGFIAAFNQAAMKRIEEGYARAVRPHFGEVVRPGLDIDGFSRIGTVQTRIRRGIGLQEGGRAVTPGMDEATFRETAWTPSVNAVQSRILAGLEAPAREFSEGSLRHEGIESAKAAGLPAMALLLSIAGAVLHVFKFTGYATWIAGIAGKRGRHAWGAAAVAASFAAMIHAGNGVTSAPGFDTVSAGGAYPFVLKQAIAVQPAFRRTGDGFASLGGWQAFAADLPSAKAADGAAVLTASPEAPPPIPRPSPLREAGDPVLPDASKVPIPVFRDRS